MIHEQFCLLIVARVSSMCPQSLTLSKLEKYGSQTLNRGTARAEYGVEDEHTSSLSTLASEDMVRLWFTCNNGPPTWHLGCKVHVLSTFFLSFAKNELWFFFAERCATTANQYKPVHFNIYHDIYRYNCGSSTFYLLRSAKYNDEIYLLASHSEIRKTRSKYSTHTLENHFQIRTANHTIISMFFHVYTSTRPTYTWKWCIKCPAASKNNLFCVVLGDRAVHEYGHGRPVSTQDT
jgi:hypothetical protein